MAFLKLNRYGDPGRGDFDPAAVIEKACQTFTDVHVLPGDALAMSAERASALGAADHVVRTLRRNQQEFGPAYAFEIAIEGGGTIHGRARRYDVTFLFPDPLSEEWHERLLAFLQGLGAGRIEESVNNVGKEA
jgi:hypothetical protein